MVIVFDGTPALIAASTGAFIALVTQARLTVDWWDDRRRKKRKRSE